MKKRFTALFLAVLFVVTGVFIGEQQAFAQESVENVAISDIWTEDALIGYAQLINRGVYLAEGVSIINDAGGNRIGCGGYTTAALKCKVSINCVVEKKVNGSWTRVTSWTNTSASAYSVSISKYLSVGSGYYYRVRSTHSAGTDASSSYTEGLWM